MESRTAKRYFTNDAPDNDMNDLYAAELVTYYALHDDHVDPSWQTIAQVDGENPPADHQWVEVTRSAIPAGYSYDAGVTDETYDSWVG